MADRKGRKTEPRAVAVGTEAVRLCEVNAERECVVIVNSGSVPLYLGSSNAVATATGTPLAAGASLSDDVSNDEWWAIAEAAGEARVLEII